MIIRLYRCFFPLIIILLIYILSSKTVLSQSKSELVGKNRFLNSVWIPDQGDGTYTNPIIDADYSDPDAIRVGDDYYMTSSSFSHFPGLPILHSKDLVNWKLIGHAAIKYPVDTFSKPQHGSGIWAPSMRYHNGEFYIYFGDPDNGIFMTRAKNPSGPWEPLHLVRKAKGWIDPCPLWDDDGDAYLVHAWAKSRSGIKHIITVNRMSADGREILDEGKNVFCDSLTQNTIEGPKFYKQSGYYFIFAPAGGVKPGWQTVLRSGNIYGPYEAKVVLERGSTNINGPHQGAWVQTQSGEDWFLHFQDRYAYGRIVHLQPMRWNLDWPEIGEDYDKNGIGEPVYNFKKPNVGKIFSVTVPQTNDDFKPGKLGLQWQWEANFKQEWFTLLERKGWLRLFPQKFLPGENNFWNCPSLLTQKIPARKFNAVTKLELNSEFSGVKAGLIIFGINYSYIAIEKKENAFIVSNVICKNADKDGREEILESADYSSRKIFLKVEVESENETDIIPKVICRFWYSRDGKNYKSLGKEFIAREGKWVGAKIGLFSTSIADKPMAGSADFDWIRFSK